MSHMSESTFDDASEQKQGQWDNLIKSSLARCNSDATEEEIKHWHQAIDWVHDLPIGDVFNTNAIVRINWLLAGSPENTTYCIGRADVSSPSEHVQNQNQKDNTLLDYHICAQTHGLRCVLQLIKMSQAEQDCRAKLLLPSVDDNGSHALAVRNAFSEYVRVAQHQAWQLPPDQQRKTISEMMIASLNSVKWLDESEQAIAAKTLETSGLVSRKINAKYLRLLWLSMNLCFDVRMPARLVPRAMEQWLSRVLQFIVSYKHKGGGGETSQTLRADDYAWILAEFVRIHPFITGNGRTSRLLLLRLMIDMGAHTANMLRISIKKDMQDLNAAIARCMDNYFVRFIAPLVRQHCATPRPLTHFADIPSCALALTPLADRNGTRSIESRLDCLPQRPEEEATQCKVGVDFDCMWQAARPLDIPSGTQIDEAYLRTDFELPNGERWYAPLSMYLTTHAS